MAQQVGNEFRFGIEIELLIGGRKTKHSTYSSLANDLSKRLLKAGIANHVKEADDKSKSKYIKWSIVPEATVQDDKPAECRCTYPITTTDTQFSSHSLMSNTVILDGLELVSPIYQVNSPWEQDLHRIFTTIHTSFNLKPSVQCATHIHISRFPTPLSASDLAALGKAALHYESALDALVPEHRLGRTNKAYWARSNRLAPLFAGLSLSECLARIGDAAAAAATGGLAPPTTEVSYHPVVQAMNLFPCNSVRGSSHRKQEDFLRGKGYKWDFTGMLSAHEYDPKEGGGRGTVEFRQPPGSMTAMEAETWTKLAVAFVVGVLEVGPMLLPGKGRFSEDGASLDDLWVLLVRGGKAVGWEDLGLLEGLLGRDGKAKLGAK